MAGASPQSYGTIIRPAPGRRLCREVLLCAGRLVVAVIIMSTRGRAHVYYDVISRLRHNQPLRTHSINCSRPVNIPDFNLCVISCEFQVWVERRSLPPSASPQLKRNGHILVLPLVILLQTPQRDTIAP